MQVSTLRRRVRRGSDERAQLQCVADGRVEERASTRSLPLPRLHLGHTSVVSRLQELLRTLAALEKTEGDLNDDSLMKEMLFSSS